MEITLVESEGVEVKHGDCLMIRLLFVGNVISNTSNQAKRSHGVQAD